MVNTRSSNPQNEPANPNSNPSTNPNPDYITQQLLAITSKLNTLDSLVTKVAALKAPLAKNSTGGSNKGKLKQVPLGPREMGRTTWSKGDDDDIDNPWWFKSPS